jgi:membrane protein DedA with SNARE-associated domain
VFGHFTDLVANASGWAYGIVFLLAFLDAILPVVPSETAVITAGVVAGSGDLSLPVIVAAAAGGAFLGDNTAYWIGRRFGGAVVDRFFSGGKAQRRIEWAQTQLSERGGQLIVAARFIPGGRTAVTLSAGLLEFSWKRFIAFDVVASLVWALYAALLGYIGGQAFEHAAWKGLLLALGLGFAMGGVIEGVRSVRKRRRRRASASG